MNDIPTLPKNLFNERSIEEVRFWSASTICGRMSERIDLVCKSMRSCVGNIKKKPNVEQNFNFDHHHDTHLHNHDSHDVPLVAGAHVQGDIMALGGLKQERYQRVLKHHCNFD